MLLTRTPCVRLEQRPRWTLATPPMSIGGFPQAVSNLGCMPICSP
jgi:hypothetical protein